MQMGWNSEQKNVRVSQSNRIEIEKYSMLRNPTKLQTQVNSIQSSFLQYERELSFCTLLKHRQWMCRTRNKTLVPLPLLLCTSARCSPGEGNHRKYPPHQCGCGRLKPSRTAINHDFSHRWKKAITCYICTILGYDCCVLSMMWWNLGGLLHLPM